MTEVAAISPAPCAIVPDVGGLLAVLHQRQAELGLSDVFLEDVCGISNVSQVFKRDRRVSAATLGALLDVVAVDIAIVPSPEKARRMAELWEKRQAGEPVRLRRAMPFTDSALASVAGRRRWEGLSAEERSEVVRKANRARRGKLKRKRRA
jgi:hypothetical protein